MPDGNRSVESTAALSRIAHLTTLVLSADAVLGAACRHRDIPWEQVHAWLPDRTDTRTLLDAVVDKAAPFRRDDLRDIASNSYPVREGEAATELTDRMVRLRHATWMLAHTTPDYSVVTLHDLAGLGMAAHLHMALAAGLTPTSTDPLLTTARAFHALAGDLHDYLAPGPPDPQLRADILAARQLLTDLAPPAHQTRAVRVADATTARTLSALRGACDLSTQIAVTARGVFATLARSGQLHVPTRLLTGEHLSEEPEVAAAKLAGAVRVVAPGTRTAQTLARYDTITAASADVPEYTGPGLVHAADYPAPGVFRRADFLGRP
jgi:hypothetical protein